MERSLWWIVREAEIEREREREGLRESEAYRKEKKMTERREKIIKKLIFSYTISGHTMPSLKCHCSYVPNVLAFDAPHEGGFLVCQILTIWHLAHLMVML